MTDVLREFIYLDGERVRSLLAPIEQGLLGERSDSSGAEKTVEGKAGISVPMLAEFGGAGKYVVSDQSTKTRTLYDYVYNYTEDRLLEGGHIVIIPDDFVDGNLKEKNVRAELNPVEYVLVRVRPVINDYGSMISMMKNINKIQPAISRKNAS